MMTPGELRVLLDEVRDGGRSADDAHRALLAALRAEPLSRSGVRQGRSPPRHPQGFPEVILGLGKTPDADRRNRRGDRRPRASAARHPRRPCRLAGGASPRARRASTTSWPAPSPCRATCRRGKGTIAIASAGTSDLPVAEEAAVTAEIDGQRRGAALRRRRGRHPSAAARAHAPRKPRASSSSSPAWKARCRAWSPAW